MLNSSAAKGQGEPIGRGLEETWIDRMRGGDPRAGQRIYISLDLSKEWVYASVVNQRSKMSTEQTPTPEQDPQPTALRQITVSVPEDRVEQFEAFYQRFLAISERGETRGERGRGPRGRGRRGGYRRHHIRRAMFHLAMAEHGPGDRHGRCGRGQAEDEGSTPAATATL